MADDLSLERVAAFLSEEVNKEGREYAKHLEKLIDLQLAELGVIYNEVPRGYLEEAGFNAAKDIFKISMYHPGGVDALKTFGYLCFWVRKIKPIIGATRYGKPCRDVNERISIHMAAHLCVRFAEENPSLIPNQNVDAVRRRVSAFLDDSERLDYLIHSMRFRTFGPHHYVMLMQNIVQGFEAPSPATTASL